MPDLLGATNPVPGYDNVIINRTTAQIPSQNIQLQNVPDLTKVSRADHRTEQQSDDLQGKGNIRYDSNFQTFLQRLQNAPTITESLSAIFSGKNATVVLSGMQEGIAVEMAKVLQMLQMDEKQIGDFLKGQVKSGSIFDGPFFNLLRGAYARSGSDGIRGEILNFLKSFADCVESNHLARNISRNLSRMADAIPARWAEKLCEMISQVETKMAAGDRMGVLRLLQKGIFPYMGAYTEQTHDMGLPRQLLSLLALDIIRYENGTPEKLLAQFHQLQDYGVFGGQLKMMGDEILIKLIKESSSQGESRAQQFTDALTSAASEALKGKGDQQVQQGFQNLMAAMLVNESVYMPVNHYILPLQWEGRMLFSEIWVDPDAEREEGQTSPNPEGNVRRMLIKVDVQNLGLFDIVLINQKDKVDIQIACPKTAEPFEKHIENAVRDILVRNKLNPVRVSVFGMKRPVALTEVFPKIFQRRDSINVKA